MHDTVKDTIKHIKQNCREEKVQAMKMRIRGGKSKKNVENISRSNCEGGQLFCEN